MFPQQNLTVTVSPNFILTHALILVLQLSEKSTLKSRWTGGSDRHWQHKITLNIFLLSY